MDSLVELICNGCTEFTPDFVVRFMAVVIILEIFSTICLALSNVGR